MPASGPIVPDRPLSEVSQGSLALWNLGFRPFYLLAGIYASVSVLCWVAQFAGWLDSSAYAFSPLWHAHEMIFGYAFAVIVGFLFTAGRNWTNLPTPTGAPLAAIAALWICARAMLWTPWSLLAAAADFAFALAAAAGLAVPIVASRNRRNYFFPLLLLGLGAASLAFHLAMAGWLELPVQSALQIGLDLILFLIAVMGGRVIPMFTANAIPGTNPVRLSWLELVALGSILALIALDLLNPAPAILAAAAAVAGGAHALRLALWRPWVCIRRPILWVLHVSYAWIAVHLVLRALAAIELVPASLATHALTVGAVGGITIGMMTRTSRGHTGRPLEAGAMETAAYVLVQIAAAVRVFLPMAAPELQLAAVVASGLCWAVAFLLFTVAFWPVLTRPRIDGRPG